MNHYINVILPIPLQKLFSYKITKAEAEFLKPGMRVAVPFGKTKIFTALVHDIHENPPIGYTAKEIHQILDDKPIITNRQLTNWKWIAAYYMCSLGEVMRAAIPSALLLESETLISRSEEFDEVNILNDDEYLIFEALQHKSVLNISEIGKILDGKNVLPTINKLLKHEVVTVHEKIFEQ